MFTPSRIAKEGMMYHTQQRGGAPASHEDMEEQLEDAQARVAVRGHTSTCITLPVFCMS